MHNSQLLGVLDKTLTFLMIYQSLKNQVIICVLKVTLCVKSSSHANAEKGSSCVNNKSFFLLVLCCCYC